MSLTLPAIIPAAYVPVCEAFNEARLIKYGNEWDTEEIKGKRRPDQFEGVAKSFLFHSGPGRENKNVFPPRK